MSFGQNSTDGDSSLLEIARLQWRYCKTLSLSTQLLSAEQNRTERVEQLYLEFKNHDLQLQLDQINEILARTAKATQEVHTLLRGANEETDQLKASAQGRPYDTVMLEPERYSVKSRSLPEELQNMLPRLAQLKAQAVASQSLASENRSLRQQLNTLRKQLESDKSIREDDQVKELQETERSAVVVKHLKDGYKQFSKEEELQLHGRPNSQQQNELEPLQQDLKPTKDGLYKTRSTTCGGTSRPEDKKSTCAQSRAILLHQRPPVRYDSDMAIGTPGPVQAHVRGRRPAALPGDKSNFSITPFLNRTSSLPDSKLKIESDSEDLQETRETVRELHKSKILERRRARKVEPEAEPQEIRNSPSQWDLNTYKPESNDIRPRINIDEELRVSNGEDHMDPSVLQALAGQSVERQKRRKLGVRHEEDPNSSRAGIVKPCRKLTQGTNLLQHSSSPVGSQLHRQQRSHLFSAHVDFSPLKRNRR